MLSAGSDWSYSDAGLKLDKTFAWNNYSTPTWSYAPALFGYGPIQGGVATTLKTAQQMVRLSEEILKRFDLMACCCQRNTLTSGRVEIALKCF